VLPVDQAGDDVAVQVGEDLIPAGLAQAGLWGFEREAGQGVAGAGIGADGAVGKGGEVAAAPSGNPGDQGGVEVRVEGVGPVRPLGGRLDGLGCLGWGGVGRRLAAGFAGDDLSRNGDSFLVDSPRRRVLHCRVLGAGFPA
jgi:hypothetical protein